MQNNQKELILLEDLGYLFPNKQSNQKKKFGIYKCFCGIEFKAGIAKVKNKHTKSCGCLKTTHSLSKHKLYQTWTNMISRCNDINSKYYSYYGGRGITVCEEWNDVKKFIEDMYPSYHEGLSIDRKDNNKGYSKDNCRWVSKVVQSCNTRKIRINNTSGYRGVYFHKRYNIWVSSISINKKRIYLGNFSNKIEAAKAYDQYVIDNNLEHSINGVLI